MKKGLNKAWIFIKASFKVIVITLFLVAAILAPAYMNWGWPITLVLGVISLSLTVLAGTDFVKKHTKVSFSNGGVEYDLWMLISISVSLSSVGAIWIDANANKLDKLVYTLTVIVLLAIVGFSAWLTKKNKAP